MACQQYQEQFTDFLEGTLSEQAWRELELHLQQCEHCSVAIKSFRRTVSALRGLALVQPPRSLTRAIDERLAQEAAAAAPAPAPVSAPVVVAVKPARRRAFPWTTAGVLVAACLVVAAVALYNFRPALAPGNPQVASSLPGTPVSEPLPTQPAPGATLASNTTSRAHPASAASIIKPQTALGRTQPARENAGSPGARWGRLARTAPVARGPYVATTFGLPPEKIAPRPVSMDIKVDGSSVKRVGTWQPVAIILKAGGDVSGVTVSLLADSGLQVRNRTQSVSLQAGVPTFLKAQVRAERPGTYHLKVRLASATVTANTTVDVTLQGLTGSAAALATRRAFRSVTLAEAAQAVGQDCGVSVEVDPALAGRLVSADFSEGVSGGRALRALAYMVGGRLVASGEGYRLVPAE